MIPPGPSHNGRGVRPSPRVRIEDEALLGYVQLAAKTPEGGLGEVLRAVFGRDWDTIQALFVLHSLRLCGTQVLRIVARQFGSCVDRILRALLSPHRLPLAPLPEARWLVAMTRYEGHSFVDHEIHHELAQVDIDPACIQLRRGHESFVSPDAVRQSCRGRHLRILPEFSGFEALKEPVTESRPFEVLPLFPIPAAFVLRTLEQPDRTI